MRKLIVVFLALVALAFAACGCEEVYQRPFGTPDESDWVERFGDDDIANLSYNVLKLDRFVAQNDRALFPKFRDPNDQQNIIAIDRLKTLEERLKKLEEQMIKNGDKIITEAHDGWIAPSTPDGEWRQTQPYLTIHKESEFETERTIKK